MIGLLLVIIDPRVQHFDALPGSNGTLFIQFINSWYYSVMMHHSLKDAHAFFRKMLIC